MKKNIFKKNLTLPCLGIGMMLALNACGTASQSASAETITSSSTTVSGATTSIQVSGDNISIKGNGATREGKTITISEAGTYELSGTLEEGQIKINTDGEVKLILNNFNISNSTSAPIIGKKGNVQILLKENSKNTVSDKRSAKEESDSTESEESSETTTDYDAAIYSEGDLLLSGTGSLTVEGGYEDGIHSKTS